MSRWLYSARPCSGSRRRLVPHLAARCRLPMDPVLRDLRSRRTQLHRARVKAKRAVLWIRMPWAGRCWSLGLSLLRRAVKLSIAVNSLHFRRARLKRIGGSMPRSHNPPFPAPGSEAETIDRKGPVPPCVEGRAFLAYLVVGEQP